MEKTPRALYDSECKVTPAEQQEEIEKDIFNTCMDNLLPTKASDHKEHLEGPRLLRKPDNVFNCWKLVNLVSAKKPTKLPIRNADRNWDVRIFLNTDDLKCSGVYSGITPRASRLSCL
jgi:hypothetical protein